VPLGKPIFDGGSLVTEPVGSQHWVLHYVLQNDLRKESGRPQQTGSHICNSPSLQLCLSLSRLIQPRLFCPWPGSGQRVTRGATHQSDGAEEFIGQSIVRVARIAPRSSFRRGLVIVAGRPCLQMLVACTCERAGRGHTSGDDAARKRTTRRASVQSAGARGHASHTTHLMLDRLFELRELCLELSNLPCMRLLLHLDLCLPLLQHSRLFPALLRR
jgi:hypothetical protein